MISWVKKSGNHSVQTLPDDGHSEASRREVLKALAVVGVGSTTFRRALAAQASQAGTVTPEMIKQAEWIAGLELTEEERTSTARSVAAEPPVVRRAAQGRRRLRRAAGLDVLPDAAAPGRRRSGATRRGRPRRRTPERPDSDEELAFLPVTELSALIRSRQVSSTELTKLYLDRLKRFDPLLKCVVTLTEDLALEAGGAGRPGDRRRRAIAARCTASPGEPRT